MCFIKAENWEEKIIKSSDETDDESNRRVLRA